MALHARFLWAAADRLSTPHHIKTAARTTPVDALRAKHCARLPSATKTLLRETHPFRADASSHETSQKTAPNGRRLFRSNARSGGNVFLAEPYPTGAVRRVDLRVVLLYCSLIQHNGVFSTLLDGKRR